MLIGTERKIIFVGSFKLLIVVILGLYGINCYIESHIAILISVAGALGHFYNSRKGTGFTDFQRFIAHAGISRLRS